jgi:hypothetical protein
MNDMDKAVARRAIEEKKLTIEQVEALRAEVDRTGKSFLEVAQARGLLAPPKPPAPRAPSVPILYQALLAASVLIFSGLLLATLSRMRERTKKDDDLAIEAS